MARTFNGSSDHLDASIGGWNSINGDATVAILGFHTARTFGPYFYCAGTGASIFGFGIVTDTATIDTPDWFINATDSYKATDLCGTTGWYLIAGTKAAGTNAPRAHVYSFASGTWTHVAHDTGTSQPNKGTGSTSIAFGRVDAATTFGAGDFAVAGAWSSNFGDQQVESLLLGLDAWFHPNLVALHLFDQAATGTAVADISGQGANQTGVTGTSVSTRSVPRWGWDTGALLVTRPQSAAATNASAEIAAVTVAAGAPSISIQANAGNAAVVVAAQAATASVKPNAGNTGVAVAGLAPTLTLSSNAAAGNAAVTVAALAPTPSVAPNAGNSAVTVAAKDPTLTLAALVPAGNAAVTVAAKDPTASTASQTNANAGNAAMTVAANALTASVKPNAGNAAITVAAKDPTVSTVPVVNASAGNAAVTVAGLQPASFTVKPNAGNAAVTVAAQTVSAGVSPKAGNAAITVGATGATLKIAVVAGVAVVTVVADDPSVSGPIILAGRILSVRISSATVAAVLTSAAVGEGITSTTTTENLP